jgi:hypothetical protein
MPPLSDGLPEEARKKFILGKLLPGCVVRLEVKFPDKSKPKFLVLVAVRATALLRAVRAGDLRNAIARRPA